MIPRELLAASDFTVVRAELVRALDGDGNTAIVLTRIHWRAEREDGEWWRGTRAQIAEETGLAEHQVKHSLKKLKDAGHLEVKQERTGGAWDHTQTYRVVMSESSHVANAPDRRTNVADDRSPVSNLDRSPVSNLSSTKTLKDSLSEAFAEFWEAYPKKVDKKDGERKFRLAAKDTDPQLIIAGARRYAASRRGQDPKYTKQPGTWLHHGCWDDDLPKSNGHRLVENTAWSASAWTP